MQIPRPTRLFRSTSLGITFAGAVVVVCALSFLEVNRARALRAYSQVHSIAKALQSSGETSGLPEEAWRPLSESETHSLLQKLLSPGQFDPAAQRNALTDPWGRSIHILCRVHQGKLVYAVWSDGPDRRSETADDIRVPDAGDSPKSEQSEPHTPTTTRSVPTE